MPYATTDDGVRLYFEETGSGRVVIFVHEFAGDVSRIQERHLAAHLCGPKGLLAAGPAEPVVLGVDRHVRGVRRDRNRRDRR